MDLPELSATSQDPLEIETDALVVPVFRGAFETPGARAALDALGYDEVPRDADFRGDVGDLSILAGAGLPAKRVVLVGLGRLDSLDPEQVRRAAGTATRQLAGDVGSVVMALPLVSPDAETLRAAGEGALLGAYRYLDHRSEPDPPALREVVLAVPAALEDEAEEAVHLATAHARATTLARDLVNTPPAHKSPARFCEAAANAMPDGVEVEIWDESRLADEKCGGVLAVGRGSSRPPRMLILRHEVEDAVATVYLVGKGIVFDTGGISLKRPSEIMEHMKADMGGAGAIVGAMSVLPDLDLRVSVVAVCGVAENMPSGDAQRPSDVIRIRNGTTVEVMNTDAEGRLVMADALSYAAEHDPDAIVDVATLTGAAKRALGDYAMAAFSNDDDLLRQVLTAADDAGESMWHMPLWEDLRENLDSEIADIDNIGRGNGGGATIAGLFLREFVDDEPWVHLDIAGPAWASKARYHHSPGGTGAATRTLLRWLEQSRH